MRHVTVRRGASASTELNEDVCITSMALGEMEIGADSWIGGAAGAGKAVVRSCSGAEGCGGIGRCGGGVRVGGACCAPAEPCCDSGARAGTTSAANACTRGECGRSWPHAYTPCV